MLGRAFADDPVWSWIIKKRPPLDARIGVFLGIAARIHLAHDNVWMTDDGCSAAIWAPPKLWRIPPRQILRDVPRSLRAAGLRSLPALSALAETERRHPGGDHWYLATLGTDPHAQGRGLASAVLAPVLDRCDDEGLGAYLESSKEGNVPFYVRHGFEVTDTIDLARGGPRLWTMWRDPRPCDDESGKVPT
jgi:GNAT superfamily N-acetyltransferase